jgi:hypothetical protein
MRTISLGIAALLVALLVAACGSARHTASAAPRAKAQHRSHLIAPAGIGGVGLDMSPQRVREVLGTPTSRSSRPFHRLGLVNLVYRYGQLKVQFAVGNGGGSFVYMISTTSPAYRTPSGIGVGTKEADVRASAQTCVDSPTETVCGIESEDATAVVSFEVKGGRVFRVSVFAPPF